MQKLRIRSYDTKDRFYKEPEHVLDQFRKNYIKILLGDFKRTVSFATLKINVQSTMFPHRYIHRHLGFPDGKENKQLD